MDTLTALVLNKLLNTELLLVLESGKCINAGVIKSDKKLRKIRAQLQRHRATFRTRGQHCRAIKNDLVEGSSAFCQIEKTLLTEAVGVYYTEQKDNYIKTF